MIKAIFWDNDGVLVDTEELFFKATHEILAEYDVELNRKQYVTLSLVEGKSTLALALEKGFTTEDIAEIRMRRNTYYQNLIQERLTILEGVPETLERLYGEMRMAVVTSTLREHFDAIHAQTTLTNYFDFVIAREDYQLSKPNPEPYLLALQKTGLEPHECLVVEDSERGLAAALAAQLKCVIIPNAFTKDGAFKGAFRILENVRDIIPLIRNKTFF